MMATAAVLFGGCCEKQCDTVNPTGAVMENILNRKSVRSYNGDTIPAAVVEDLLRAAMAAPTGMDIRPWSFVVLTDKSQYETIFEGNGNMKKFMESGVVIVVCADTTVTRPTRENPDGPADGLLPLRQHHGAGAQGFGTARQCGALRRRPHRLPRRGEPAQGQMGYHPHPL